MNREEKNIVTAIRNREDWAWTTVREAIVPLIKYKIFRAEEWEDACQDCMEKIAHYVEKTMKIKDFWALAKKVAICTVTDYNRKTVKWRNMFSQTAHENAENEDNRYENVGNPGAEFYDAQTDWDYFLYIYQRLDEICQKLLFLVFVKNLRYSEAAMRLNISEGNLRVRIKRCREKAVAIRNEEQAI